MQSLLVARFAPKTVAWSDRNSQLERRERVQREQGVQTNTVMVTGDVYENALEARILDVYFEDEEGNRIEEHIDIELSDDDIDYEYNGTHLQDDILRNILVEDDQMQIELKTIKQRE
ncbi:MAG: hypothetical protein ACK5L5_08075 [Bacteroidales bacterium]